MTDEYQIDEQPRALRYGDSIVNPMYLLQEQMRKCTEAEAKLLSSVACEQFELAQALQQAMENPHGDTANEWQAVNIIVQRLESLLGQYRVKTENPSGKTWSNDMLDAYELITVTRREGLSTSRIDHVITPMVSRFGRTISMGQVTIEAPTSPAEKNKDRKNTINERD